MKKSGIIIIISITGYLAYLMLGKQQKMTTVQKTNALNDSRFLKALHFTLNYEGGYVNNPNDEGGATNRGITQGTYNSWRKANNLPVRAVANLTTAEMQQIYYKNYWLAVGADKTASLNLAIVMFDTAVLCGVRKSKQLTVQANYDVSRLLQLRLAYHQSDRNAKYFLAGWTNRVNSLSSILG